jgi:CheY-like chemotaxis protein
MIRSGKESPIQAARTQAYVQEAISWLGADTDTPDVLPASGPQDLASADAAQGERQTVLLADDNADMRQYVEKLLSASGYGVLAATDGEAALSIARSSHPDLVLSDVMMPKLDGFGLLTGLRDAPATREIPVILLSARASQEAEVEGLKAGADDYLAKPFAARELLARVETNLRVARIRKETARATREEAQMLEFLNRVGTAVAAELDLERAVQVVTDAATELSGGAFGAFFYNVIDAQGEAYTLYTLSGAPREAFASFPMPRNTAVFAKASCGQPISHKIRASAKTSLIMACPTGIYRSAAISQPPWCRHRARCWAACSSGIRSRAYSRCGPSALSVPSRFRPLLPSTRRAFIGRPRTRLNAAGTSNLHCVKASKISRARSQNVQPSSR